MKTLTPNPIGTPELPAFAQPNAPAPSPKEIQFYEYTPLPKPKTDSEPPIVGSEYSHGDVNEIQPVALQWSTANPEVNPGQKLAAPTDEYLEASRAASLDRILQVGKINDEARLVDSFPWSKLFLFIAAGLLLALFFYGALAFAACLANAI